MFSPKYKRVPSSEKSNESSSERSSERSSGFSGISSYSNMSSRKSSSTSSSNEDISSRSRESIDSFGSFQGASNEGTSSRNSSVSKSSELNDEQLLENWKMEFEKNYKGKEAELVMSEMMGIELDLMQHNAIRKLIKNNNFDPTVWKTANDEGQFPSDCNKDGTFKHCIFMGSHENGDVYLDQWGNFFDKNLKQYDVVGIPDDFGLYEFKIHKPVELATSSSYIEEEEFEEEPEELEELEEQATTSETASESARSETTTSESASESARSETATSETATSENEDNIATEVIDGEVIISPERNEYEDNAKKYPKTIALGKAILATQNLLYLPQNAQVDVPNRTEVQIVSTETEGNNSIIAEAQPVPIGELDMTNSVIYPDEDKLKEIVKKAISSNNDENNRNAYDYMFTDSSLIKLFEDPEFEGIPISDSINIIESIVYDFVKANTPPEHNIKHEMRIDNIANLKKFLEEKENSGIKNITKALVLPEKNMKQYFGDWNDFEGFKNICEKLEIFLLQITSYIHRNTCTKTKDFLGKIKKKLGVKFENKTIQTCEENKFFIYNQMYNMVLGLRVVFEGLKEFYSSEERPVIDDELERMEKILEILNHYEKYYKKHKDSRKSYDSSISKGGKTQRKRKTRKYRKTKNKAKSHKKRIRIKSRKLR